MIDEKTLTDEIEYFTMRINSVKSEEIKLYEKEYKKSILKMIDEQPKVNEWIVCPERMPEDLEEVLVWYEYSSWDDGNPSYQTYGISYTLNGKWSSFVNGSCGWKDLKIIAWIPLPKPYEEKE